MRCCTGGYASIVAQYERDVAVRQQQAAKDLQACTNGSHSNQDTIVAADAVPLLVALLRSNQPSVQEPAAIALWNITNGCQQNKDAIIAADAVPVLVALLQTEQPAVQELAAGILAVLGIGSQQNQNAIVAAGLCSLPC